MAQSRLALIGAAIGWGAQLHATEQGPFFLRSFLERARGISANLDYTWAEMLSPSFLHDSPPLEVQTRIELIARFNAQLAAVVMELLKQEGFPVVIGGDHSMALGTWGGVVKALNAQKEFGLIWIDAHMDAHTLATTPSNAVHGMPVACLLGHGAPELVNAVFEGEKINPSHLILIGARSFEAGEAALLERLKVRIYFMEEVEERGFASIFQEAITHVASKTKGFGVSIDLDGFDPVFAPGVGSPVNGGLRRADVLEALSHLCRHPSFKALEIAEFNPLLDKENRTAALIRDILAAVFDPLFTLKKERGNEQ